MCLYVKVCVDTTTVAHVQCAIVMHMCPLDLERHLVLNSDRYDIYPKVKSAIRDYVEEMRHKSDPMQVGEVTGAGARGKEQEGFQGLTAES